MAYDQSLAKRVEKALKGKRGITQVRMFGGLCFMHRGNMACGIEKDNLVIRVGKDKYETALKEKHARPFDLTGRPLTGFVYVSQNGVKTPAALKKWLDAGFDFAKTLPAKV